MTDRTPHDATAVDALFAIATAIESLATAVTRVSHGNADGPTGLEMLSMAMVGPGASGHDSVADAIRSGFGDIAEAIAETGKP